MKNSNSIKYIYLPICFSVSITLCKYIKYKNKTDE